MIKFIDINTKEIYEDILAKFQEALGEPLLPGDERRIFLESIIPIIIGIKYDSNFIGNQNLTRYATGSFLNSIGDMFDVIRFSPYPATTNLMFSIGQSLEFDVSIPKGTRATADGDIFFATNEISVIPAGQTQIQTLAICLTTGVIGNGITTGRITSLVDLVPYVSAVTNVNITIGGLDSETDDNYRERIRLVPESYSVAGSIGAYQYFTKSSSPLVADSYIESVSPGNVDIYILSNATVIPTDELKNKVRAVLSNEKIRPLTDSVNIKDPTTVEYNINLTYFNNIDTGKSDTEIALLVNEKVNDFVKYNKSKLGLAINPDKLKYTIMSLGIERVNISSPIYTELISKSVAVATDIVIIKG